MRQNVYEKRLQAIATNRSDNDYQNGSKLLLDDEPVAACSIFLYVIIQYAPYAMCKAATLLGKHLTVTWSVILLIIHEIIRSYCSCHHFTEAISQMSVFKTVKRV